MDIKVEKERIKKLIQSKVWCDKCQKEVKPVVVTNFDWVCPGCGNRV
jgi:Zn finger protein HypA/HybF involved in hydrogenase expression